MQAELDRQLVAPFIKNSSLRKWGLIHKWSSLICTIFMLMLCITGLPLIFHEEIELLTGDIPPLKEMSPMQDIQRANLDLIASNALESAQKTNPNLKVIQYLLIDKDDSRLAFVTVNSKTDATPATAQTVTLDARTGEILAPPKPEEGFMYIMFKLHTDLFVGLAGTLFLGFMGLLLTVAIISGVVLYAPFMRKLNYAEIRSQKTQKVQWLDWHNLIGIITMSWFLVVGLTGVINTIGNPLIKYWQATRMADMIKPYSHLPQVESVNSIQESIDSAQAALPSMIPYVIAMPGTPFASKRQMNVFMRGNTPVTSRLFQAVLIDGETSEFVATEPTPWYLTTLFISQPLHFGDYGGLPLKFVWLLLDLLSIGVLVTGLYLWVVKRGVDK